MSRARERGTDGWGCLRAKVALVTGAGTGIGKGVALRFARRWREGGECGAAGGDMLKQTMRARSGEYLLGTAWISPKAMTIAPAPWRRSSERHGQLDILVSNAGAQLWKDFLETSDEEIETIYDTTNLSSTVRFIKQAVPYLEKSKGNIVIISSTAARYTASPSMKLTVYSASKAGLNQLTRTLAPELGPLGIRINAVAPGLTRGEYADEGLQENDVATDDWISGMTPLGRMGEPDDIAKVVTFMASDMASWVRRPGGCQRRLDGLRQVTEGRKKA